MTDLLWYQRWGGRKFLLCVGFGLIFCAMFAVKRLSEPAFQFLMGGTVVAFIAGNVLQKKVTA
jgi:hypothetical protein